MDKDKRIRVPAKHEDLLAKLVRSEDSPYGVFSTRADALTFAAALGYSRGVRSPLGDTSEPIRMEIFERRGHDIVFYLLAVDAFDTLEALSSHEDWVDKRVRVFEEYANGGLDVLAEELRGVDDVIGKLLLLVDDHRPGQEREEEFDLTRFLK